MVVVEDCLAGESQCIQQQGMPSWGCCRWKPSRSLSTWRVTEQWGFQGSLPQDAGSLSTLCTLPSSLYVELFPLQHQDRECSAVTQTPSDVFPGLRLATTATHYRRHGSGFGFYWKPAWSEPKQTRTSNQSASGAGPCHHYHTPKKGLRLLHVRRSAR